MIKVFDLDGTILDSNGIWRSIDEQFVKRHGCQLTDEYNEFVSHAIFPVAAKYTREYYHLSESEEEIMEAWLELARDAYSHELPLKPDVKPYLEQCKENKERMALFTSSEPSLCRAALRHHGLLPYFEELYFAQELRLEKRYVSSFQSLSELLGAPPSDCTLFDDSPLACASAKQAGWKVVGVYDPFFDHRKTEMQQVCDQFIPGFHTLLL